MKVSVTRSTPINSSARVQQLSALFDAPITERSTMQWTGDIPIDGPPGSADADWHVGLLVGPSGAGKSTLLGEMFGTPKAYEWAKSAVVDDFAQSLSMEDISLTCQSVGFNTIPAWMRPYKVLSTGEKFRVDLARHLLEDGDLILVDEFTSVVDRQVAQIGAHAVQKWVRKHGKRFVAASCHYDIVDWLQPDWVLEPHTMQFARRSIQRRPPVDIAISRVPYGAWKMFAPFHYLTADLHRGASCFVLFANGHPASFGGMLHRPHPKVNDIEGLSRLVTLPDWQGLGLALVLSDTLGAAYKALGKRMHTYPAHPALVRSFNNSQKWKMIKKPGVYAYATKRSFTSTITKKIHTLSELSNSGQTGGFGGRPNATFEYCGPTLDSKEDADRLINQRIQGRQPV
jgi:ABC-type lipoprotein export system ATPase subunit